MPYSCASRPGRCTLAGDRIGEGAQLHRAGIAFHQLNAPDSAARYFGRALSVRREAGDQFRVLPSLHNLGLLHDWRAVERALLAKGGRAVLVSL